MRGRRRPVGAARGRGARPRGRRRRRAPRSARHALGRPGSGAGRRAAGAREARAVRPRRDWRGSRGRPRRRSTSRAAAYAGPSSGCPRCRRCRRTVAVTATWAAAAAALTRSSASSWSRRSDGRWLGATTARRSARSCSSGACQAVLVCGSTGPPICVERVFDCATATRVCQERELNRARSTEPVTASGFTSARGWCGARGPRRSRTSGRRLLASPGVRPRRRRHRWRGPRDRDRGGVG